MNILIARSGIYDCSDLNVSDTSDLELCKLLPSDGVIEFLRNHNFDATFRSEYTEPVLEFCYKWRNAEHEFIDETLDAQRIDLLKKADSLLNYIGRYTTARGDIFQSVKPENYDYSIDSELKIRANACKINRAAEEFVNSHQELIRIYRGTQR